MQLKRFSIRLNKMVSNASLEYYINSFKDLEMHGVFDIFFY